MIDSSGGNAPPQPDADAPVEQGEGRFRAVFEQASVGMTVIGPDGAIREANDAMCRMLGYRRQELTSLDFLHITHPDDLGVTREVNRRLRTGESDSERLEKRYVRQDGGVVWADVSVFAVRDRNGELVQFVTHQQDVTDRKQAEAALRESEERFRTAFDDAPIGMSLTAVDGTLIRVNRALCRLLGRTEQELVASNMAAVTHPDDVEMTRRVMRRLVESGENACRFQKRFVRTDGYVVLAELDSFLLRDAEGRPLHFITHILDITDRTRAESALQESERRFREMADLLPDIVFELDRDLRVTYVNRAATDVMGYTLADLDAGVGVADVVDPAMLPRARERLLTIVAAGEPSIGVYDLRRRDGSTIPMEVHSTGIVGADGVLVGYRGIMRDITDRKRAEAERLAAIGQLASGVAHEFNNLLAVLRLKAEEAADSRTAGDYEELTELALRSAEHGRDVCRSLNTLGRPRDPQRQPLHVESVLERALLLAGPVAGGAITVMRDFRAADRYVHADPGQLEQVFLNLITNACHAMFQGGDLTVRTERVGRPDEPGRIVVTIGDTGTGIEPAHLGRIFEPYFTTKGWFGDGGRPTGTGLGLSVSHGIVRAHGGTIEVRSEVGTGTTVEVGLPEHDGPVASRTAEDEDGETGAEPHGPPTPLSVLVAEDYGGLANYIRAVLTAADHRVVCVRDAEQAIAAMRGEHFDLVVTDLLMPGGGGREVLSAAATLPEPPQVLVITGLLEVEVETETIAMGAGGCLRKPFTRAELIAAIDRLFADGPT